MGQGTGIGRVRGLGSAKHGSQHWIVQRLTALSNLTLTLWLLFSVLSLPNYDYETLTAWLSQAFVAVPMILMLISIFWHLKLGMQVMIEDYVPDTAMRLIALTLLNFYAFGGAIFGIFVVAKLAFTGVAS